MNKIEKFLQNFESEKTKQAYKAHLQNFFTANKIKDPEKYFDMNRDYDQDIESYQTSMQGRPPKSRKSAISCIRTFFLANNVELQPKTKFNLRTRRKGSRAWTQDEIPTPEQLKQILLHGNAKGKALFLLASSSGMRIGEILQLTPDDIDMEYNPMNVDNPPIKIDIKGEHTKTGDPRTVFASNEAKAAMKAWLRNREKWLKVIEMKLSSEKWQKKGVTKDFQDKRIFPFTYNNAKVIWNILVEKAGLDQRDSKTNRRKYHIHSLRKYYRSHLGIDIDVTEALMGHEEGVKTIYRKYSQKQLAEMYLKGMNNLAVFETTPDLSGVHEQLKEKDRQISELEKKVEDVDDMKMQLLEFRLIIQELKNKKK